VDLKLFPLKAVLTFRWLQKPRFSTKNTKIFINLGLFGAFGSGGGKGRASHMVGASKQLKLKP
jgi:hypothetical protein